MVQRQDESGKDSGDVLAAELRTRLEQQAVIADLGMKALSGLDLQVLTDQVVELLAQTLGVEYVNLLELDESRSGFTARSTFGWPREILGNTVVGLENASQAGYTLLTGAPVVVSDLATETRFEPPPLLVDRKVISGLTVVVPRPRGPWGVLGAHTDRARDFSDHDVNFVQALANIVGDAVERTSNEEAKAHLAAIVESSYDAVFRKTLEGEITSWNAGAQQMYGYTAEEVIGKPVLLLFPSELKHNLEAIMRSVKRGEPVGPLETTRVRKDGTRIAISLTVSPVRDQQGEIVGASTIAHDISDRKRVEAELQRAREDLEQRVSERTRELQDVVDELESFSYAVSHDLRAPLRAVDGFARALAEDYGDDFDAVARGYVERITKGSKRMSGLIDDLLNLSRLSHSPLTIEDVDLTAMARRVGGDLEERNGDHQGNGKKKATHLEVPETLPARGDRHLLEILLTNLMDNAWKFSRSSEQPTVTIGGLQQNGELVYFVADNGIGFDMRYAHRLFVPFQRLHGGEVEGTGIGLATVKRIVHRHGGRLWATGAEGEGSTFYFTLGENQNGS